MMVLYPELNLTTEKLILFVVTSSSCPSVTGNVMVPATETFVWSKPFIGVLSGERSFSTNPRFLKASQYIMSTEGLISTSIH